MRTPRTCLHARFPVATLLVGAALTAAGGVVAAGTAGASTPSMVITTTANKTWGSMLTLGNGRALYRYADDSKGKSVCTGKCAVTWPPVLLPSGEKLVGKGISGLSTITRSNGAKQVTYEGIPLYTFIGDKSTTAVTGNGKDSFGNWWVVNPAHPTTVPKKITSSSSSGSSSSGGSSTAGSTGTGISY